MSSSPPPDVPALQTSPAEPLPARAARSARALSAVAALSAAALVAALFDLVPAAQPDPVAAIPFDPEKAVAPIRLTEAEAHSGATPANRQELWSFRVCAAPREGARLYRLALAPDREAFAVWCAGEYVLLDVAARADLPVVTRVARFPARGELPGGATALDLDRDGVVDLALAVAPPREAVHRPFAGVYFLRGRAQGGFELPRTLVEMPTVALLAADLDAHPGEELVVLTRGDPAAQRPGELWVFAGGTSPRRAAVVPTTLAPLDVALGTSRPTQTDLWVVASQPGSLLRLRLAREPSGWTASARAEVGLRGVQGFVAGPRDSPHLYVRDALGVYGLAPDEPPKITPFRADARVGPAAWLAGDSGDERTILGATGRGFAQLEGIRGPSRERALPDGHRVLDASSVGAGAAPARGVLLIADSEQPPALSLVVLPSAMRAEASEIVLRSATVETPANAPQVVLE